MEYEIKQSEISKERILAYSKLLTLVFAGSNKFTPEFLNWQYAQNPAGHVVGFDAFFDGELAGHYVTIPVIYKIHNKETKGLLSLNTATHPKHQGKGLFTKLASRTYEEGKKSGYQFVIGVANGNSTHGFVNKLGFSLISELDVKIGMGQIGIYDHTSCLIKSLWKEQNLQWRLANPSASYFSSKDNYVLSPTDKFGIDAQLMCQNKSSAPLKLKNKKSLLKVWIGIAEEKRQKGFFIDLPRKFKPSPLNLIFKDLTGNIPSFKKEEVFFELIDFDAY